MNFKHTLVDSQEAQRLTLTVPDVTDMALRFAVISAINTAIVANLLVVTVSQGAATEEVKIKLQDELIQLGYAVNGTTTPGSWIISWA